MPEQKNVPPAKGLKTDGTNSLLRRNEKMQFRVAVKG
jgi:hypothetical protein